MFKKDRIPLINAVNLLKVQVLQLQKFLTNFTKIVNLKMMFLFSFSEH